MDAAPTRCRGERGQAVPVMLGLIAVAVVVLLALVPPGRAAPGPAGPPRPRRSAPTSRAPPDRVRPGTASVQRPWDLPSSGARRRPVHGTGEVDRNARRCRRR